VREEEKAVEKLRDAALLLGVLLITLGAGMIYLPAGLIVGGIMMIAMAVIDGFDDSANDEGSDGQA
jgi:hypothetical protein